MDQSARIAPQDTSQNLQVRLKAFSRLCALIATGLVQDHSNALLALLESIVTRMRH
jgi:hypothetical protein